MNQYKEFCFRDDKLVHAHGYILKVIEHFLVTKKNRVILDVGCGNGSLAIELINKGYNIFGIDASNQGIEIAKTKFRDRFFVHNIYNQTLPNKLNQLEFDTIISTEVIEHLYDPRSFIEFCNKILKLNGELIISTPYHGYLKNLFIAASNKFDNHFNALWDGGHIKFWSKKTLTNLLNEFGYDVIDFKGAGRIPFLWKSMIIKATLKKNFLNRK